MDKETAKKVIKTMALIDEAESLRTKMIRLSIRNKVIIFQDRGGFQPAEMFPELDEEFNATPLEKMIWEDIENEIFRILTDRVEEVIQNLNNELKKL